MRNIIRNVVLKMIIILSGIFLGIFIINLLSKSSDNINTQVLSEIKEYENSKILKYKKQLIGKNLNLNHRLNMYNTPYLLSYIRSGDCETCLDTLLPFINSISRKLPNSHLLFYTNSNAKEYVNQYIYSELKYAYNIFVDEGDKLIKQLNYAYTPILILLNKEKVILDVYFPLKGLDKIQKENFLGVLININS